MAEARDFHCYSHVFENLGNRTIPSDQAVRLVVQKPTYRGNRTNAFQVGCPNIPSVLFCCGFTMTTDTLPIHLAHLQSSKLSLKRPKSRLCVSSHGRHLTAWEQRSLSPPLHYVPTEIDILGRSCDVVKHGSECLDCQRISQIIANFTHENLAEREAEITNLPWRQTEKDNALARRRVGQRAWRAQKPVLCLNAVTDEDSHPLENEDESGRRLCEYWVSIFQARIEGPRHPPVRKFLAVCSESS